MQCIQYPWLSLSVIFFRWPSRAISVPTLYTITILSNIITYTTKLCFSYTSSACKNGNYITSNNYFSELLVIVCRALECKTSLRVDVIIHKIVHRGIFNLKCVTIYLNSKGIISNISIQCCYTISFSGNGLLLSKVLNIIFTQYNIDNIYYLT